MSFKDGIHHISVLAGNPSRNFYFYVNVLGMRLVKKSVNQDDPSTYHLFYANSEAEPGSSLTFFPWPRAHKGKTGSGESVNVAFRVPENSLTFWENRFQQLNIAHSEVFSQFGEKTIRFNDPVGLEIDFIFKGESLESSTSVESTVPDEYAVQGFWSTRLRVANPSKTIDVLTNLFEFVKADEEGGLLRLATDANKGENVIIDPSESEMGKGGRGIVHHVAFRAKDEIELSRLREIVISMGMNPSEIIDRHWFKSVYFREPNGILFEIATDGPGYTADEEFEHLGETLILPPWLEPRRTLIENTLPELNI